MNPGSGVSYLTHPFLYFKETGMNTNISVNTLAAARHAIVAAMEQDSYDPMKVWVNELASHQLRDYAEAINYLILAWDTFQAEFALPDAAKFYYENLRDLVAQRDQHGNLQLDFKPADFYTS